MAISNEVRSMILERAPAHHIRQVAVKEGMISLRTDGWRIIREGRTTVDEVMRNTKDEEAGTRFGPAAAGEAASAAGPSTGLSKGGVE